MTRISWKELCRLKEDLTVVKIHECVPTELNKYKNSDMIIIGCVVGVGLHYLYTKLPDLKSYFYTYEIKEGK